MIRNFTSLGQFGHFLQRTSIRSIKRNSVDFMTDTAKKVKKEAKDSVGQYKAGVGPYPRWAKLKDSTVERKQRNSKWAKHAEDPLIRSKTFKNGIGYKIDRSLRMTATIGTNEEYIIHTELGTKNMPPRPVFGPAALRVLPRQLPRLRSGVLGGMLGLTGMAAQTYANGQSRTHIVR